MPTPQQLLQEADRCVKCGLCLPHCPTYRLNLDEGDSPRGRISLIQAWVGVDIASRASQIHLDRCLGCLACESACDSVRACPGRLLRIDCADDCVAAYSTDVSGECTAAQIDLLNCRSGLSCAASPFDAECDEAVSALSASCGDVGLRRELVEVSGTEVVVEIGDHSWSDSDESETESADETEDDAPEVTDVHDTVVVVEIPGAVEVIDFQ